MGMPIPIDGMAVLVQSLVPADMSGVIFTADPATGNPWRFVINATFGLASRLMDGMAAADRFTLAWDTQELLEKRVDRKKVVLTVEDDRVGETILPDHQQEIASLSDEMAQRIARMALAVDREFDQRMDIEWAFTGNDLYLLQARPITALPAFFPHELPTDDAEETWRLSLDGFGKINEQERLVAPYHRDWRQTELWNYYHRSGDLFPYLLAKERDFNGYRYTTEWNWGTSSPDWPEIETWLDENEPRFRHQWLACLERIGEINAWVDGIFASAAAGSPVRAADWVRTALAYRQEEKEIHAELWYAPQWLIFTCQEMLKRLIAEEMAGCGIPDLLAGLLQGSACYAVERIIDAQSLGRRIHEDFVREAFASQPLSSVIPTILQSHPGCAFLKDLRSFYEKYGGELPAPDDPDQLGVLLAIKNSLFGQGEDAKVVLGESIQRKQVAEVLARDWLENKHPGAVSRFNKILDWAQFWTAAFLNRMWGISAGGRLHRINRKTMEILLEEGLVDKAEHFLLLTIDDWAAYIEHPDPARLRALYEQRKLEYERCRRLEPLPYLGKPPVPEIPAPPPPQEPAKEPNLDSSITRQVFQGEGIAPGKARGTAYQVKNLNSPDFMDQLTGEHILICGRDEHNAQWRRDWYALFMIVRGLAFVEGAQLHHATQIARECGIPFINLRGEDLEQLPDGCQVEIDGQAGTMRILS
jgi:phosphohistidine swiveling domain-containing protein